ncbi:S8 family serine peptidase, partial [Pseudovibrio sp. POLY-S9]|uniref:S8 family serine peptidase n=1 Tax=Pseudovibrio sp. POLY-S9 TaxID=1576596 RepID=UPI00128EBA2E
DIANNSWGTEDLFANAVVDQNGNSVSTTLLEQATGLGRIELGTIVVVSGGNDRQEGHDTNAHDLTNSRYSITVGAINAEGDLGNLQIAQDPFSNPGASILVSAPGSNVTSTSRLVENDNGSTFGDDYEATQGTSFAAPIVSG